MTVYLKLSMSYQATPKNISPTSPDEVIIANRIELMEDFKHEVNSSFGSTLWRVERLEGRLENDFYKRNTQCLRGEEYRSSENMIDYIIEGFIKQTCGNHTYYEFLENLQLKNRILERYIQLLKRDGLYETEEECNLTTETLYQLLRLLLEHIDGDLSEKYKEEEEEEEEEAEEDEDEEEE